MVIGTVCAVLVMGLLALLARDKLIEARLLILEERAAGVRQFDPLVPMNQEHFAALKELDAITPEAPPIAPAGPPRTPPFPEDTQGLRRVAESAVSQRPPRPRPIWIPAAKTFDQAFEEACAAFRRVGTGKATDRPCDGSCEGSARLHTLFGHAGAPPVAPPVSPEEIARRLSARWLEAVQGPSGWQVAQIEIDPELFVASLGPAGACTTLTIKDLVEQDTNGVKFVCAPSRT